jgi:hypothetical protein
MSVMGAITLDFIEQLKSVRKGWILEPIAVHPLYYDEGSYHDPDLIPYLPVPPNTSPIDHFIKHALPVNKCFIRVKVGKSPLRLISLTIPKNDIRSRVNIAVWRANGWVRHQEPAPGRRYRHIKLIPENFPPQGCHILWIFRVYRVKRISRKKPPIIQNDFIDLSMPQMDKSPIEIAARIVEQSLKPCWKMPKERFDNRDSILLIDLNQQTTTELDPYQKL